MPTGSPSRLGRRPGGDLLGYLGQRRRGQEGVGLLEEPSR